MEASLRNLGPAAMAQSRHLRLLLAAVVTGIVTALLVAAIEYVAVDLLLHEIHRWSIWIVAIAPLFGLLVAGAALRWGAQDIGAATSDEYVKAYHARNPSLPLRHLPAKLFAGIATIGSGASLGLEGPSIYAGSVVGLNLQHRLSKLFRRDEAKLLLVAGAAAGVAAVFKAPATGLIFALESPYRDDVTRRALLPALLASAAGYVTYVAVIGSEPVIPFINQGTFNGEDLLGIATIDLLGAVLLGVGAGLAARGVAWLVRRSKKFSAEVSFVPRAIGAGIVLAGLALLSDVLFDAPLTIGPGFEAMRWVVAEDGLLLIGALLGLKIAATLASLVGGGVGGLFIPLATMGVVTGQFVGELVGNDKPTLYPTLGLAAFLGAGYRAPLTAVMFVAESTGGGLFVVPALIAAAVSQVVTGPHSVSTFQQGERMGHLEQRFALPVTAALTTDVMTVPSDAMVSEFMYMHVLGRRELVVPVVDGAQYVALVTLDEVAELDRAEWDDHTIGDVCRRDVPTAKPSWTLRDIVAAMESADLDLIAVVDDHGSFVGVVRDDDIVKLGDILDSTGG